MDQRLSGQTVRFMFENSPIGMCSVAVDGTIVRRNAACAAFVPPGEPSILAAIVETQRSALLAAMRAVATGAEATFKRTFDAGTDGGVEISGVPMRAGSGDLMLHLVDVSDLRRRERELREQAERDALTGLDNVRGFRHAFDERLATRPFGTLLMIDLDGFKAVNDTFGHKAGDDVLVAVARALRETIGPSDRAARIGGDEFAVLLSIEGSLAVDTAAQIIARIGSAAGAAVPGARVGASIGLVTLLGGSAASALLEAADRAMYAAKRAGKGRTVSADHDRTTHRAS
jgi:diguanylate cyclase (GGDEF)-like protein